MAWCRLGVVMPERMDIVNVTCAPLVLDTAPVEVAFARIFPGVPRKFTIVIPDGHAGLTGISLGFGHQPVIPSGSGDFISGNDESIPIELKSYPAGPMWSAFVYNLDTTAHSWQVRFEQDEIRLPVAPTATKALNPLDIVAAGAIALNRP